MHNPGWCSQHLPELFQRVKQVLIKLFDQLKIWLISLLTRKKWPKFQPESTFSDPHSFSICPSSPLPLFHHFYPFLNCDVVCRAWKPTANRRWLWWLSIGPMVLKGMSSNQWQANPGLFLFIFNFYIQKIILVVSRIWTQIVWVKGEDADHLTTSTAKIWTYFLQRMERTGS